MSSLKKDKNNYVLEERGTFCWATNGLDTDVATESVTGLLRITDRGLITLELDDFFFRQRKIPKQLVMNADGINLEGTAIRGTLANKSQEVHLSGLYGGHFHRKFYANGCLIGRDRCPLDLIEPSCKDLGIDLEGYENWLDMPQIDYSHTTDEISFKYVTPNEDIYETPNATIRISYNPSWSVGANAVITPRAFFRYEAKTPLNLKEAAQKFGLIQDLLIMLSDSEYLLKQPVITLSQNNNKYTFYFARNANTAEPPGMHEGPTNFAILRPNFGQIFATWEARSAALGSAFYSYLSTRRGIMLYIEDNFKNLVGGLEAFHRKTIPDQVPDERILNKIKTVMDQISEKDKKWAKLVLKRAHIEEPSLGTRLYELFSRLRPDIDQKKLKQFAERCANDRNDLSHFAGQRDTNDNTMFYQRLIKANGALSYFYQALILLEIGLPHAHLYKWADSGFGSFRIKRCLAEAGLLEIPKSTGPKAAAETLEPSTDLDSEPGPA